MRVNAEDFHDNGLLKLPRLFWCGTALTFRAWLLMVAGGDLVVRLYPEPYLLTAVAAGALPALFMVFVCPLRGQYPRLAGGGYGVFFISQVGLLLVEGGALLSLHPEWLAGWCDVCVMLAVVVMLWPDRRVRAVFTGRYDGVTGGRR